MSTGHHVQTFKVQECLFGIDWLKIFVTDTCMFSAYGGNHIQRPEFLVYPYDNSVMDYGYEFPQVRAVVVTDQNRYKMPWGEIRKSHSGNSARMFTLVDNLSSLHNEETILRIEFHVKNPPIEA